MESYEVYKGWPGNANKENENPLVSKFFRAITAFEIGVLLVFGRGLFFVPGLRESLWLWQLTPFNSRVLGAIYLGSLKIA